MRIPERQAELDALVREYLSDPDPEPGDNGHHTYNATARDDEEVIRKARAERGGKFDRLWHGDTSDYGHDHSSADDAFVHKVWPYTQDEEQIQRMHASSGLHRPEKSGRRADYLQRSIKRARKNVTWFYEWPEERTRNSHAFTNSGSPINPNGTKGAKNQVVEEDGVGTTKRLADAILKDDHFAQDAGGKLYRFQGGAYRQFGERYIKMRVKQLLEEWGETKQWSSHRANETAEYIRVDS